MAPPGCPDLAFSTMAADKILMLSAALFVAVLVIVFKILSKNYYLYVFGSINKLLWQRLPNVF